MTDVLPVGERRSSPSDRRNRPARMGAEAPVLELAERHRHDRVDRGYRLDPVVVPSMGGFHRQFHGHDRRRMPRRGACWALIREKYRLIFFGTYPYEQHWRPLFAVVAMLAMLILSADRRMWNWRLLVIWASARSSPSC